MYRATDYYNQHHEIGSSQHYMECLKWNYEKGTEQNLLSVKETRKRRRLKCGKIFALINRIRTYKGEVYYFTYNPIATKAGLSAFDALLSMFHIQLPLGTE